MGYHITPENASQMGAKSKRGPSRMTKMLNQVRESQSEDQVQQVFDVLRDLALSGDIDAIKVYLSYIIGKPTEKVEMEHTGDLSAPVIFKLDERYGRD